MRLCVLLCFAIFKYTVYGGESWGEKEVSGMKIKMNLIKSHYVYVCNPQAINKKF